MRYTARVLGCLVSPLCVGLLAFQMTGAAVAAGAPPIIPMLPRFENDNAPDRVPGRFFVIYPPRTNSGTLMQARAVIENPNGIRGTIISTYDTVLVGFAVDLPVTGQQAFDSLLALLTTLPAAILPGVPVPQRPRISAVLRVVEHTEQMNPPVGLDRIDKRLGQPDGKFIYNETGDGVHVFVVDSGIRINHAEFLIDGGPDSRASWDYSAAVCSPDSSTPCNSIVCPPGSSTACIDPNFDDCTGHGTAVAGIIGGTTFGVAKKVRLHSVRIRDAACMSDATKLADGIEWITKEVRAKKISPAIANLSVGVNAPSSAVDVAVRESIAYGVTYVVAAGKGPIGPADACNYSPGRVTDAITVGGIDVQGDVRTMDTNYGACVALFAPGLNIESAMPDGRPHPNCVPVSTVTGAQSQICDGTSVAAPHVTGCAALHLEKFLQHTPARVASRIIETANVTTTVVDGTPWLGIHYNPGAIQNGDPNVLLHCGPHNDLMDDSPWGILRWLAEVVNAIGGWLAAAANWVGRLF